MGFTDLGIGQGFIYAVRNNTINRVEKNNKEGVASMKLWGLKSKALGLGSRGVFTIEISDITDSGSVTQVLVNGVNQISGTLTYDVGEESQLASQIANLINTTIAGSGPDYVAVSVGNLVVGYAPVGASTNINGHAVAVANSRDITIVTTPVSGVPDQTVVYSTAHGYQFYVNASPSANPMDFGGADDVTHILVPQTLDGGLPAKEVQLQNDVAIVPRVGAVSYIQLTAQTGNEDDCVGINPVGYADNDLVFVSGKNEDNEITFIEQASGNLKLRGGETYVSSGTGTWIIFRHFQGEFYELIRSGAGAQGFISLTYGQAVNLAQTSALIPGANYLITDRGHRGIALSAVSVNKFSLTGTFIAAVPPFQAGISSFLGIWTQALTPSVNNTVSYLGLVYRNITGNNDVSPPPFDATNWSLESRASSGLYAIEHHSCEFDFDNDWVQRRADHRGNEVFIPYETNQHWQAVASFDFPNALITNLDCMVWGKQSVNSNVFDRAIWGQLQSYVNGEVARNTVSGSARVSFIASHQNSRIVENKVHQAYGSFSCSQNGTVIRFNRIFGGAFTISDQNASGAIEIKGVDSSGMWDELDGSAFVLAVIPTDTIDNVKVVYASGGEFILNGGPYTNKYLIGDESNIVTEKTIVTLSGARAIRGTDFGKVILLGSGADDLERITSSTGAVSVSRVRIAPASGLTVTVVGGDGTNNTIIIPPALWDDESASGDGEFELNGSNGDYAVINLVEGKGWVVEQVYQF